MPPRKRSGTPGPADDRAALLELAKLLADGRKRGRAVPDLRVVVANLAESPGTVLTLLDLLQTEARRKRPNGGLIDAFLTLLGEALREARLAVESDASAAAAALIDGVRRTVVAEAEAGRMPVELLMALAQQFASAKLDPGDDLRALVAALADEGMDEDPPGPGDLAGQFAAVAAALDHDPFLIREQLSEQITAFPEEHRRVIVASLVASEVPAMRDAAVGWLLDPSPETSAHVAQGLAAAAARGLVSAESAARMTLMRPWVPEAVQAGIDAAVRACRQRNAAPPAPAAAQVGTVMASGCDGAGAQTFLALVKRGRTLTFASLLVKHGFGLRDALVMEGLGKREVDQIVDGVGRELDPFDASLEIVRAAIAHGLAVGLDRGEPPPFALVQYLEILGLTQVRPERMEPDALVAELVAALPPERQSGEAVAAALAASKRWPDQHAFPHSWFEPDTATRAALRGTTGKKRKEAAVLEDVLPPRRRRWAELLAWTAKAAQDQVGDDAWMDFALVARELLGERPLADIPVAVWIAKQTVAVAGAR